MIKPRDGYLVGRPKKAEAKSQFVGVKSNDTDTLIITKAGKGVTWPKVGDRVAIRPQTAVPVIVDEEQFMLVSESDVLAVLDD